MFGHVSYFPDQSNGFKYCMHIASKWSNVTIEYIRTKTSDNKTLTII